MKLTRTHIIGITAVGACVVLVAGIVYWQWTKAPSYSLKQVSNAIETHDLMKFQKYVDIESAVARFVDQTMTENLAKQQASGNSLGADFAQGIIQAMKPQLQSTIEQQIKALVEKGSDSAEEDVADDANINLANFFQRNKETNLEYRGVEGTKKEGKIATVTLAFYQPQTKDEMRLDVKMRQMDGYWQVAELPNASAFVDQVNTVREKILAEKNKPLIEEMKKALSVQSVKKDEYTGSYGFERKALFEIQYKNVGQKDIKAWYGIIKANDLNGQLIKAYAIKEEESLPAGKETSGVWEFDTNQFIDEENRLYKTQNEQMKIDVQPWRIVFADDSEIKLFE